MLNDYLSLAHTLKAEGTPFVLATVVRTYAPTSAKAGAKAIITADGVLNGWVGGSCTQPTVIRESLKALKDGSPRFLRLGPPETLQGETPGVIEVPLTCVSGGTLEIYLDPHLPPTRLLIVGHLPVVEALVDLGKAMNYEVTVMGEEVTPDRFPRADQTLPLNLDALPLTPQTYVVVASHGNYDEPALETILKSEAAYVALIASRKRRDSILEYLRESNLNEAQLARLKSPAGLDIGAVTPEEIALSIIGEIVQLRRRGPETALRKPAATTAPANGKVTQSEAGQLSASILAMRDQPRQEPGPGEAIDPVCYMIVEMATARYKTEYEGQTYYFCAPGCKRTFEKNPKQFVITNNQ